MTELLEIVLNQTFSNQQCINRWNYIAAGTPSSVSFTFALVSAMGFIESVGIWPDGELFCDLLTFQNIAVHSEQVIAKNIYDVTDFYGLPLIPQPVGAINADAESPLLAFGFRSNQTRRDIRRGTKRFVGVSDNQNEAGGGIVTVTLGQMQTLADKMGEVLEYDDEGNTLTFTPCIVGKEKYTAPSGNPAYRYYADKTTQMAKLATSISWEPYTTVRSQTSRQYGKGI